MRIASSLGSFGLAAPRGYTALSAGIKWSTTTNQITAGRVVDLQNTFYDQTNDVLYQVVYENHFTYAPANAMLVKMSGSTGSVIWAKMLTFAMSTSGTYSDFSTVSIAGVDSSGNVFLYGSYFYDAVRNQSNYLATIDGFVAKITPAGAVSWAKRLTGPASMADQMYSGGYVDSADGVVIAGSVYNGTPTGYTQGAYLRFTSTGTLAFQKRIGASTAYSGIRNVLTTSNNSVITVGNSTTVTDNTIDIVRCSATGTVDIQKRITVSAGANVYLYAASAHIDYYDALYVGFTYSTNRANGYNSGVMRIPANFSTITYAKLIPTSNSTNGFITRRTVSSSESTGLPLYTSNNRVYVLNSGTGEALQMPSPGVGTYGRRLTGIGNGDLSTIAQTLHSPGVTSPGEFITASGNATVVSRWRAFGTFNPEYGTYTANNISATLADIDSSTTSSVVSNLVYADYTNTFNTSPLTISALTMTMPDVAGATFTTLSDIYPT